MLRRAAELDSSMPALAPGAGDPVDGVTELAVQEAAEEAGFTTESVSTALAELRAGALTEEPAAGSLVDQRLVRGDLGGVGRTVERILDRERFCVRRRDGDRVVWVRGPRSWSDALRLRRGPDLGPLADVSVTLAPVPGEVRTLVRVESSHRTDPADAPIAGAIGTGVGVGAGALVWAATGDPAWLVAGVPAGGVIGAWRWRDARREARLRTIEVADALSRLLDAIDRR